MRAIHSAGAAAALFLVAACASAADEVGSAKAGSAKIGEGSKVSIEYTLKLDDGTTADSNVGGAPLVYEQGKGQILPSLEKELTGLGVNDSKKVKLSPRQGYGEVNPEAIQKVPAEMIPEEARQPGAQLLAEDGAGQKRPVRVKSVEEDQVVVDLNHPLAGKTLHFDVKILAIE
jgi:FKBP-type peptidyl-prolyl cis-trans isomerase SlyD